MGKIRIEVYLDREEYDNLVRLMDDDRYKGLWDNLSQAGRRAFYLLKLESQGRLKIIEPISARGSKW